MRFEGGYSYGPTDRAASKQFWQQLERPLRSLLLMTINFQCTLEDYAEANRGHMAARQSTRFVWGWRFLLIFSILVLALAIFLRNVPAPSGNTVVTRSNAPIILISALLLILPMIIMFSWIILWANVRLRAPRQRFNDVTHQAASRIPWRWLPFVLTIIACPLIMGRPDRSATTRPVAPTTWFDSLLLLLPWVFVFGFLWFFVLRRLTRRMFQAQPSLMRPKTLELNDGEATITDALTRLSYKWPAFVRFIETRNIFLLYISEVTFHIVPKRSFSTPEEVAEFRRTIRSWADALSQGFPVLPALMTPAAPAVAAGDIEE